MKKLLTCIGAGILATSSLFVITGWNTLDNTISYAITKSELETLEKDAAQGDSEAQLRLGSLYYTGYGVEQDYTKAVEWFTKAANQGNANAQSALGKCYYYGYGVEQDYTKAAEWLTKAVNSPNISLPLAEYALIKCYYYGDGAELNDLEVYSIADEPVIIKLNDLKDNDIKTIRSFYTVCWGENIHEGILDGCYRLEQDIKPDYATIVEWHNAANQGDAKAQFNLGHCYYYGKSVNKDYTIAAEWLTKAANQGLAEAQFSLGNCYCRGEGVEQNHAKAIEWYIKAANQGFIVAQYNLIGEHGYHLIYDSNTDERVEKLFVASASERCAKYKEYLTKAANLGDIDAQFLLGIFYDYGCRDYYTDHNCGLDYTKAIEWFTKAANQGDIEAQYYLDKLLNKM